MRLLIATLLLCVPVMAQHDPPTYAELEARIVELEAKIAACCGERPECPATVEMHNGEVMYVTGHEYTVYAKQSGLWSDPATWDTGVVPEISDKVFWPHGTVVELDGECECSTIACGGVLEVLDGAHLTASTITGLPGAHWYAGTAEQGIGYSIDFYGLPFEPGDAGLEFGNGFVWCGHDSFHQYGYELPPLADDLWFYSDGVRHDADYSVGDPGDVFAKVNLDSNSIQWRWTGEGPRPHRMFMHGSSHDSYCSIRGFGRTDTSRDRGPDNINSRYPDHSHFGGEEHVSTRHHVYIADFPGGTGCPGWGVVNHASNVVATETVACDVHGAGLVCEDQIEVGAWGPGCMAIGIFTEQWKGTDHGKWTRGQGIVAAPKVLVDGVVCSDVNIGVEWTGSTSSKYGDGVLSSRTLAVNPGLILVSGYTQHGIVVQWTNTGPGQPPITIRDAAILNATPFWVPGGGFHHKYQAGFLCSYARGMNLVDCTVDNSLAGIFEQSPGIGAHVTCDGCTFTNVRYGTHLQTGSSATHRTTIRDCVIEALFVGVRAVASTHNHAERIYTLSNNTITAPTPIKMVYNQDESTWDGTYFNNPKGPVVNEMWVDGERWLWPWQE